MGTSQVFCLYVPIFLDSMLYCLNYKDHCSLEVKNVLLLKESLLHFSSIQ